MAINNDFMPYGTTEVHIAMYISINIRSYNLKNNENPPCYYFYIIKSVTKY